MKPTSFLFIAMLPILLVSCSKINGEGDIVTESRTLEGYNGISLNMDATVNYTQDTVYSLVLKGQQNILDHIETVLENNTLVLRYEKNTHIGWHEPIVIEVTAPDVSDLYISGSGQINMFGMWKVYSADLNISGSGDIHLAAINSHDIKANISGSGNISASWGLTEFEDLIISGSGNIDLLYVECDSTYANISGSGDIMLTANKYLNATISGSGNIKYRGNPIVETHISGSGSLIHL